MPFDSVIGLLKRLVCALAVLQAVCFAGAPAESKKDVSSHMLPVAEARLRTAIKSRLDNEDDYRSLCSGTKACLNIDFPTCLAEDQVPWPKVKYDAEYCAPFIEITKRGFKADPTVPMSVEIYARLGRQYRAIYENKGTLPLGADVISYLFDNMPFTAELINAYLDSHYELKYTSPNRRFFSGSNGRSLSGEFYWALQDSAGQKLGMRNLFFGYGHAKILKWSLHGTAVAYLDMDEVSRNELKYKLTAIVFPANTVLNSIMQMKVFKSVVNEKIDNIVDDIKKASKSYFSGNKEPMLRSAVLKSDENVQYIIDFENVVNGGHWRLGDFEKLQKERAERDKNSVPIIMNEKPAPAIIEKKKGK